MNKNLRSPLFYVGDKYQIINQIKEYFPKKINRFIEPFSGGGTVFLNISADEYLLNDIDDNIIKIHTFLLNNINNSNNFFKEIEETITKYNLSQSYLKDVVPVELKKKWKKTYYAKYNKEGYNKLRNDFNNSIDKNPLYLYLLVIYGFNRMLRFNAKNNFNVPVGNVDFNKNVYLALNNYFKFSKNKNIKWNNLDYVKFLDNIKFKKGDFVYLDPPYLISNSEYNKLWDKKREKEMLNLLDKLNSKGVNFAISNIIFHKGIKNDIFTRWMKKYKIIKINSNYISYHNNKQKNTEEVLVKNYE